MITISVIIGSTREGRFSEKPARWILQHLRKREGIEARLIDLRDFPMPFFDEPLPPAMPGRPPYEHDVVKRWTDAIGASDGFIFVTPEYNYGASAVLKNAIDWVYPEWNRKAAVPRSTFPWQRFGRTSRAVTWTKDSLSLRGRRRQ
jgi:NAD(P)H-dependent FMN reductase